VRFAVYPLIVGGSVALAVAALDRGVNPAAVALALQALAFVLVALLERLLPYRAEWNRSRGDIPTDAAFLVSSSLSFQLGMTLSELPFLYIHHSGIWPTAWPIVLQLALALVVGELGVYWIHRIQHMGGLLWRIHASHHSAPRLYFLNSARAHPLDSLATGAVTVGPLVALGADERLLTLVLVFQGAHAFLQHSNVDARLGPLNWVLSMAEVHRWHHSRTIEESNANYGQTVLVWDWVFGTRKVPPGEPPVETGLTNMPWFPPRFWGQLASPWRWRAGGDAPSPGT
jgi:sterol desaturase/sphingolipid hydroxylase (fatty acid hydroxylase superfamily)